MPYFTDDSKKTNQDNSQLSITQNEHYQQNRNDLHSQLKSPHFFSMSGIPRFGKNWLDNFIPDDDMQNIFLTSEVVRNVLMLQCVYYASVYGELLRYKQSFNVGNAASTGLNNLNSMAKSLENSQALNSERKVLQQDMLVSSQASEIQPLKIGIIGCGQLGTMILTKLLETQSKLQQCLNSFLDQFDGLKLFVSTRQPHLLRAFQQEFGVYVDFNNERVAAECDIIFLCVLPFQAQQVLKDVRPIVVQRHLDAQKYKNTTKPLFISCLAATGTPKLKIMLTDEAVFLKTQINVTMVKEDLFRSRTDQNQLKNNTQYSAMGQTKTQMDQSAEDIPTYRKNEMFNDMNPQIMKDLEHQRKNRESQDQTFKRILSQKAFQFGAESGVTAEFIVKQTSFQLAQRLDDLFSIFDTFQEVLYSNDPNVNQNGGGSQIDQEKVVYEESILLSVLGQEYFKFISASTGEWENEKLVLANFYQMFEDRIRYLFLAGPAEGLPQNNVDE
eukprot:403366953